MAVSIGLKYIAIPFTLAVSRLGPGRNRWIGLQVVTLRRDVTRKVPVIKTWNSKALEKSLPQIRRTRPIAIAAASFAEVLFGAAARTAAR
jgi:hypothetical protein